MRFAVDVEVTISVFFFFFTTDEGREALLRADGIVVIGRILHQEAQRDTLTEEDMSFLKTISGCVLNMMAGYSMWF